jgi:hypothetical protein
VLRDELDDTISVSPRRYAHFAIEGEGRKKSINQSINMREKRKKMEADG